MTLAARITLERFAPLVLRLVPDAEFIAPESGDERPGAHPRAHLCKSAGLQSVPFHLPTDEDPELAARALASRLERSPCDTVCYLGPQHEGNAMVAGAELAGLERPPVVVDESMVMLGRTDVRAARLGVSRAVRDRNARAAVERLLAAQPTTLTACSDLFIDVAASYLDDDAPMEKVALALRAARETYGDCTPDRIGRAALHNMADESWRHNVAGLLLLWRERLLSAG